MNYETADLNGQSKIYYQVYNKTDKVYEGWWRVSLGWEFDSVKNAKRYVKQHKLKNFEIHKRETITIDKTIIVI